MTPSDIHADSCRVLIVDDHRNTVPFLLIAVTGHGQHKDRRRTLAAGFDHHLVKLVDLDDLLSLLCSRDSGTWVRQSEPGTDPSPAADEGGVGFASVPRIR
jgi:hypothetical protein